MSRETERLKWERYYASAQDVVESETARQFHAEFVALVDSMLPEGGRVLEAGCGAGEQSLALATTGRYRVTLLDFAENALKQARRRFEQAGLPAEFLLEDVFTPGQPRYDLVFNAGVLEHYNPDEQIALLRGMAGRSRRYVLALLPNRRNYWYWLWRVRHSAAGNWPFGKEIPADDLAAVFRAAGLRFLGQRYLGDVWTEDFITGLDGLDPESARQVVEVHRSGILPPEQTAYLVAALGVVDDAPAPPGWGAAPDGGATSSVSVLTAALADALALQVAARVDAARLGDDLAARMDALAAAFSTRDEAHAARLDALIAQMQRADAHLRAELEARRLDVERQVADLVAVAHRERQESVARLTTRAEAAFEQTADRLQETLARQIGVLRQVERDYTTALLARDQEIETLRGQIAALKTPPRRGAGRRLRALGGRVLQRVGVLAPLKRLRHLYRKKVAAPLGAVQSSYRSPIALGHPGVPASRRVFILTYTFFDFDGREVYAGGAERYLLELARLLREQGYAPEVVQCGNGYWVRYYGELRVSGVDVGGEAARLSEVFHRLPHPAALVIYSPFSLATSAPSDEAALGISHGVFWDYADFQANRPAMDALRAALARLDAVVSVDTNTINWARADAAAHAGKFIYLPNFVDTEVFIPAPRPRAGGEAEPRVAPAQGAEVVILYPRRLYRPRGYWLVAEALPDILGEYPEAVFHFVGQADPEEAGHVRELMARYPGRVRWETLSPEEMPRAYRRADITLIPTVHSEGTSLSCLEALASGNAVIATDVGGLPDLIVPDYTGLLIPPTVEALHAAIARLLDDPDLRVELGRRGRESAQAFSLTRWQARWRRVLDAYLPPRPEGRADPLPVAFFPAAPGVSWEGIQQRPHHLARQLAYAGIEVFWGNPTRRLDSPHPLLHILSPRETLQARRPLVFVYYPYHYPELAIYDHPFVVYDVLDDIRIHAASDAEQNLPPGRRAADYHEKLLAEADLVIVSSRPLLRRVQAKRPDALLVPNGVELAHFRAPRRAQLHDPPVIGFHGALAEWFDLDLLTEVARSRPEYRFELIGPASVDLRPLTQLPNVRHRGPVPYSEIPGHVVEFDVGILPFKLNAMTHAVRPLKALEYLAVGAPVVATPLDELRDWPGVLLAETPADFAAQLDAALRLRAALPDDERVTAFLQSSDWAQVTRPLIERIAHTGNPPQSHGNHGVSP